VRRCRDANTYALWNNYTVPLALSIKSYSFFFEEMFSLFPAAAQGPQRKGSYPPGLFRTPFHTRHASVYIFLCLLHFRPRLGTLMPSYPADLKRIEMIFICATRHRKPDPRHRAARFIYNWLLFHTSVLRPDVKKAYPRSPSEKRRS